MKSGLEGRNNELKRPGDPVHTLRVSMKSGLEGRNNAGGRLISLQWPCVSMKSGLEGRNNDSCRRASDGSRGVSMKSGLEGRNNAVIIPDSPTQTNCLNEVRPRRPEQYDS